MELQEINGYLCMNALKPIEDNRAQNIFKCPLCGSVCARSSKIPDVCPTCMLCPLDVDVMGLNIKIERTGS